jgi:hypothetical protein
MAALRKTCDMLVPETTKHSDAEYVFGDIWKYSDNMQLRCGHLAADTKVQLVMKVRPQSPRRHSKV